MEEIGAEPLADGIRLTVLGQSHDLTMEVAHELAWALTEPWAHADAGMVKLEDRQLWFGQEAGSLVGKVLLDAIARFRSTGAKGGH